MICLDPNQVIRVVLSHDEETPSDKQPALIYRAMTVREWRTYQELYDRYFTLEGLAQLDCALTAIRCNLVRFDNIDHPFDTDLQDLLTPPELEELFVKLTRVMRFSVESKKKSDSQPLSDTAKSAEPASQVSASTAPA